MAILPTDLSTDIKLIIILIYSVSEVSKNFNDPPYFSWSVDNSVGKMMLSEMHLMHHPLEIAQSVGNFVSKIDPLTTYQLTYICRYACR